MGMMGNRKLRKWQRLGLRLEMLYLGESGLSESRTIGRKTTYLRAIKKQTETANVLKELDSQLGVKALETRAMAKQRIDEKKELKEKLWKKRVLVELKN